MLKSEIQNLARAYGIRDFAVITDGDSYVLPEPSWIVNELSLDFGGYLERNGIEWREGQWVCRHFANRAVALAQDLWFQTTKQDDELAFGAFAYTREDEQSDKINFAVHRDSGYEPYLAFYNPQKMVVSEGVRSLSQVALTEKEIASCGRFHLL